MASLFSQKKTTPDGKSVDRIKAGGAYTKDNIQLVCKAVNSWRSDMPLDDFIEVCRAVANHNPKRESEEQDGRA